MKTQRKIHPVVFVVLLLLAPYLLVSNSAAADVTKWSMHSQFIETNFVVRDILKPFVAEVKKRTNGQLDITLHHSKQLGYAGGDMMRHVRDGVIPTSEIILSFTAGDFPLALAFELPFLQRDEKESHLFFSIMRPYIAETLSQKWNQYLLLNGPFPFTGVFTAKKPIRSMEDFKGLKVRTLGKVSSEAFVAMGSTPVFIEFTEVFTAIQRGTADAAQTSTTTGADAKMWEVTKYFTRLNLTRTAWAISVNKKAADALPADVRKVLFDVGAEFEQKMFQISLQAEAEADARMKANGLQIVDISPELMSQASKLTQPLWFSWAESQKDVGPKILKEFLTKTGRGDLVK